MSEPVEPARKRAAVVVLGDVGRSPRMQYHAASLASHGYAVSLVGLKGTPLFAELDQYQYEKRGTGGYIQPYRFATPFSRPIGALAYIVLAPLKLVLQAAMLLVLLLTIPRPDCILVQTPPALPALIVAGLASRLRGARLIIDWHNYGYTLLALRLGKHPMVKLYHIMERLAGRLGHRHLCVSNAMKKRLAKWNVNAAVVYDKPPAQFYPRDAAVSHTFFHSYPFGDPKAVEMKSKWIHNGDQLNQSTLFTNVGSTITRKLDGPLLMVTGTSWTPDEDVSSLIDALAKLDSMLTGDDIKLVCVITGQGPMKAAGISRIRRLNLRRVAIHTAWLEAADYPIMLGSADIGISLHTSSSGVDLPMKILDMFGSGVPAITVPYPTIGELVQDGVTGVILPAEGDLATHMADQIGRFITEGRVAGSRLATLRANVISRYGDAETMGTADRWPSNWDDSARPVIMG